MVARSGRLRTGAAILLTLAVAAGLAGAAPARVFLRAADGKWVSKAAAPIPGGVRVTVSPAEVGGSTIILLNKPAWMVLPDDTAPQITRVMLGKTALSAAEGADWGILDPAGGVLAVSLKDNANPLDPAAVSLTTADGAPLAPAETNDLRRNKTTAQVTFRLPKLAAGRYSVAFAGADRSPTANRVVRHWTFAVAGVCVSADRQEVKLVTGSGEYTLSAKGQATLACGNCPAAYLTSRVQGQHLYVDRFTDVQVLEDTAARQRVLVTAEPGKGDKGGDGPKLARLEYELETRAGLPCLLVTSRTVNLGGPDKLYCWWGWLPGQHYETSQGPVEWSASYKDVGKVGWVYLAPTAEGVSGLGWLAPGVFGESRFNTMLLYTDPRDLATASGGNVAIPFALMAAASADAVAKTAEKIKTLGLW